MLPPVLVLTRRPGQFFGAPAVVAPVQSPIVRLRLNWAPASAVEVRTVLPQLLQWAQAQQRNPYAAHVYLWYSGGWYYYAYWTGAGVSYYKSSPSRNVGAPPNFPTNLPAGRSPPSGNQSASAPGNTGGQFTGAPPSPPIFAPTAGAGGRTGSGVLTNTAKPVTLGWATATLLEVQAATPQLVTWALGWKRQYSLAGSVGGFVRAAQWYAGGWYYASYVLDTAIAFAKSSPSQNYGNPPNWPSWFPPSATLPTTPAFPIAGSQNSPLSGSQGGF